MLPLPVSYCILPLCCQFCLIDHSPAKWLCLIDYCIAWHFNKICLPLPTPTCLMWLLPVAVSVFFTNKLCPFWSRCWYLICSARCLYATLGRAVWSICSFNGKYNAPLIPFWSPAPSVYSIRGPQSRALGDAILHHQVPLPDTWQSSWSPICV